MSGTEPDGSREADREAVERALTAFEAMHKACESLFPGTPGTEQITDVIRAARAALARLAAGEGEQAPTAATTWPRSIAVGFDTDEPARELPGEGA